MCPTEIIEFSNKAADFEKNGIVLLGASVDSKFTHLAWTQVPRKQGGLGSVNVPLLSDITHEIAHKYGVYIEEDGHTIRLANRFNLLTYDIHHNLLVTEEVSSLTVRDWFATSPRTTTL